MRAASEVLAKSMGSGILTDRRARVARLPVV
jgi:hypothetical protein